MDILQNLYGLRRFVLVGWSFGGAPVFTVGGSDERVVGCATVASQTAETEGIRSLPPRPVLLLHGTGDKTLSPVCSQRLYGSYGGKGNRKIKLFENDDHSLAKNSGEAESMINNFIMTCAGLKVDWTEGTEVLDKKLLKDGDRVKTMEKGGNMSDSEKLE